MIRDEVKKRGVDQNALYWSVIGQIAEQAWIEGRQYGKESWHEYLRQNVMPEEIETRSGEIRSKWNPVPFGKGVTVISTTDLSKRCFAEYTEMVMAFGSGLGVRFSVRQ